MVSEVSTVATISGTSSVSPSAKATAKSPDASAAASYGKPPADAAVYKPTTADAGAGSGVYGKAAASRGVPAKPAAPTIFSTLDSAFGSLLSNARKGGGSSGTAIAVGAMRDAAKQLQYVDAHESLQVGSLNTGSTLGASLAPGTGKPKTVGDAITSVFNSLQSKQDEIVAEADRLDQDAQDLEQVGGIVEEIQKKIADSGGDISKLSQEDQEAIKQGIDTVNSWLKEKGSESLSISGEFGSEEMNKSLGALSKQVDTAKDLNNQQYANLDEQAGHLMQAMDDLAIAANEMSQDEWDSPLQ